MSAAGDILYVKASATYTLTTTVTLTQDGTTSGRILIEGYTSTPGARDGRPTITSATNSVSLFTLNAASYIHFRHLRLTHTASTRGNAFTGATANSTNITIEDLIIDGCAIGYDGTSRAADWLVVSGCEIKNCTSHGIANDSSITTPAGTFLFGCDIHDNTGSGVFGSSSTASWFVVGCIFDTNSYGFRDSATSRTQQYQFEACTFVDNTNDGIEIDATTGGAMIWLSNCVFYGNGGYGIDVQDTLAETDARRWIVRNCAYGSNTSGARNGITAGLGDVTLSADPFIDRAGRDFTPNSAAGGGPLIRGAAFPGANPANTTTSYRDIGAVQRQGGTVVGSGATLLEFMPQGSEGPSSNYATFNTRNGITVAEFDASTNETLVFRGVIPSGYSGGGLTCDVYWMAASATSGDVKWGVSVERDNDNNHDLDSDAFATEQTGTGTANGTSGKVTKTTITVSAGANMDSAVAGDPVRIKLRRLASDGADTMTGDSQLVAIHVKEQ